MLGPCSSVQQILRIKLKYVEVNFKLTAKTEKRNQKSNYMLSKIAYIKSDPNLKIVACVSNLKPHHVFARHSYTLNKTFGI